MSDHRDIECRIAAMHRVIALRLRAGDRAPLRIAADNLARWEQRLGGVLPMAYREWRELLAQGEDAVIDVLEGDGEDAIRRRSSSPFAGVLAPDERRQMLDHAA